MKRLALLLWGLVLVGAAGAEDTRHELTKALDQGRHLVMLQNLNPGVQDLATMLAASRALVRFQAEYDKAHENALTQGLSLLQAEKNALATGTDLAAKTAAALADLRAVETDRRQKLYVAIDAQMRQMSRRLAPALSQRVDWSHPAEFAVPPDDSLKLEQLRLLAARLEEMARAIDRIRYLPLEDYGPLRINRWQEILKDYLPPNTRQFDDAIQFMLKLTDDMKATSEQDYPERRILFAARALQYLGALGEAPPRQVQADYSWWDIYELLSDPQTPPLLEKILNVLNAGAGAGGAAAAGGGQ